MTSGSTVVHKVWLLFDKYLMSRMLKETVSSGATDPN